MATRTTTPKPSLPEEVTKVGNMVDAPALAFAEGSGKPYVRFSLAVDRPKVAGDWAGERETDFYRVVCFDGLAVNVSESLDKGARVIVRGTPELETWTGNDGATRTDKKILARDCGAEPKELPELRQARARRLLVLRSLRDATGAFIVGVCIEIIAGLVVSETIVHAGALPGDVAVYAAEHRARTIAGASRRVRTMTLAAFCRWLRDAGYRQGATIVGAALHAEIAGLSAVWGPSRRRHGGWWFGLEGLGGPYRDRPWKLYSDAPAVLATPLGDHMLLGWGGTREPKPGPDGNRHRPVPKRGQFLDVLTFAGAVAGIEIADLTAACTTFGIEPPRGVGEDLDRLRAEAFAIAAVHRAAMAEIDALGL
jgi:hypothetical protein